MSRFQWGGEERLIYQEKLKKKRKMSRLVKGSHLLNPLSKLKAMRRREMSRLQKRREEKVNSRQRER